MDKKELLETIARISGTDARKCMKCGKCSGRCPAYKDMDIRPHQFVNYLVEGKIDKLLNCKAIYNCLSWPERGRAARRYRGCERRGYKNAGQKRRVGRRNKRKNHERNASTIDNLGVP